MSDPALEPTQGESSADPRVGAVLQDKYQIARLIGEGGMGRVYEGRHCTTTRRVAVKFLSRVYEANPRVLQRFEREARAAGGLEHPNIAAVLDFGRTPEGVHYLVLEYLEGETCQKLLARAGSLPVPRALRIVNQVCEGLSVAHEAGVVHRDLKPANLFICARKGSNHEELVKVLDFGIAKFRDDQAGFDDTPISATLGTPRYMSPEQARGAKDVDQRSDIYAIGAILYELLSGRKAHAGDSPLEIIFNILYTPPEPLGTLKPELPEGLISAVERALAPRPEQRFQSVLELSEALDEFSWAGAGPKPRRATAVDATAAGTLGSDDPGGVEIELHRRSLSGEPTPTLGPVATAGPAAVSSWGPWMRAAALALVAIGMGGIGGWLAGRRSPSLPEPNAVALPASVAVVPVPIGRSHTPPSPVLVQAAQSAPAPSEKSARPPVARDPKASKPASKPAVATVAKSASAAVAPAPEPQAPSNEPARPRTPAELWNADEGWLDQR